MARWSGAGASPNGHVEWRGQGGFVFPVVFVCGQQSAPNHVWGRCVPLRANWAPPMVHVLSWVYSKSERGAWGRAAPRTSPQQPPLGAGVGGGGGHQPPQASPQPLLDTWVPARPCSRHTVTLPRIHGSLCIVDNQVEVHAPSNRLLLGYGPFVHVCFEPSGPSLPLTLRPKALVYGTCD